VPGSRPGVPSLLLADDGCDHSWRFSCENLANYNAGDGIVPFAAHFVFRSIFRLSQHFRVFRNIFASFASFASVFTYIVFRNTSRLSHLALISHGISTTLANSHLVKVRFPYEK
jgi:hypothetical protein